MRVIKQHLCAALLAFAVSGTLLQASDARPNIILIVADDLGWRDLGCYGSEWYRTPHLDALAKRGVRFSNAYSASPLCSPTRASILTGQTPGRLGLTQPTGHLEEVILEPIVPPTGPAGLPMTEPQSMTRLPLGSITVAEVLRESGYRTSFMGKWHLGFDPYIPEHFGFDVVVGGRGFPGPPPPGFFGPWDPATTNMPRVDGPLHADDVIADEAVRFLRESRDSRQPFFLTLWPFGVHSPFQAKPELVEKYRPLAEGGIRQRSAIMGAMVETLDEAVGRVIQAVDELGLSEETLIVFTSDNGGNMYDRPEGMNPTDNHPLRAGKGNNHEGGVRVPLIVAWPGRVAENRLSETVAISYDLFPTLLQVAGVEKSEDLLLDGVSLVSSFDGSASPRPPIYSMFGRTVLATGNYANIWARDGKWKLFRFFCTGTDFTDEYVLYDLESDPGESLDVADRFPEVVERMKSFIDGRIREDGILTPAANPDYVPGLLAQGWQILSGGYIVGDGRSPKVNITSSGGQVVLRYRLPASLDQAGSFTLKISTNCAVDVSVGFGTSPMFAAPQAVVPNMRQQELTVSLPPGPLPEFMTAVFHLVQAGTISLDTP